MVTMTGSTFDYIIVGAGPTGLTLAQMLSKKSKKILLIESDKNVGGCHKVYRTNDDLFTEHSPRVYSSSYVNFMNVVKDMGSNFNDLFSVYNFSITSIGFQGIKNLNVRESFLIALEYFKFLMNNTNGDNVSIDQFSSDFTPRAKDYLDRLCRLTDGAAGDRFSLNKLLRLIDDQSLHTLYQPKFPTDYALFKIWEDYIVSSGNVQILKDTEVTAVTKNNVTVDNSSQLFTADKVILAIPPKNARKLVDPKIFPEVMDYIKYIPVTYHWRDHLKLPSVHGFPSSYWGVAFTVTTDYSSDTEPGYRTVMSTVITRVDFVSKNTGKTANESTPEEIIEEVFKQLNESFPGIPKADKTIMSVSDDTAYVSTVFNHSGVPFELDSGVYTCGTHNERSEYHFTSLEAAVTNAIVLANQLENIDFPLKVGVKMSELLKTLAIVAVIVLVVIMVLIMHKRK